MSRLTLVVSIFQKSLWSEEEKHVCLDKILFRFVHCIIVEWLINAFRRKLKWIGTYKFRSHEWPLIAIARSPTLSTREDDGHIHYMVLWLPRSYHQPNPKTIPSRVPSIKLKLLYLVADSIRLKQILLTSNNMYSSFLLPFFSWHRFFWRWWGWRG